MSSLPQIVTHSPKRDRLYSHTDLTESRFGRLTVLRQSGRFSRAIIWECRCDCGQIRWFSTADLRRTKNPRRSCGCLKDDVARSQIVQISTTHGRSGTSEYNTWCTMIQRCTNPANRQYKDYGGRGITICERWMKFENFLADMGLRPVGLSLDRINNDGNYGPGNCRWTTRLQQSRNRRPSSEWKRK